MTAVSEPMITKSTRRSHTWKGPGMRDGIDSAEASGARGARPYNEHAGSLTNVGVVPAQEV